MNKKEEIGRELEEIRLSRGGVLVARDVVSFARRRKSSFLHSCFTWDDSLAAKEYRLWQARELIRVSVVILPEHKAPIRAYVSLKKDRYGERGGYRALVDILKDESRYKVMLQEALEELRLFEVKYKILKELKPLFTLGRRLRRRKDS